MEHDQEFAGLFDAVRELEPPVALMVAESQRLGRRRRRNRRLGIAASALTVAALALAGTAVPWPQGSDRPVTAAQQTPAPVEGEQLRPVPTADTLLELLSSELRPTDLKLGSSERSWSENYSPAGFVEAGGDFVDRSGLLVAVRVRVGPKADGPGTDCPTGPPARAADSPPRPAGAPPAGCRTTVLADGSLVRSTVTATNAYGLYSFDVSVRHPDGSAVLITVASGTVSPDGAVTSARAVPPVPLPVLEAMASSRVWQPADPLDPPSAPTPAPQSTKSGS
ncbi:hypothetical protein [Kitasatospora sp. NPDC002040]|uniref:hypothetical protein n=1 Tax=Kitasatospora sp. NPDC002040 TaxID=3154661 RepID=UPI00333131DC